MEIFGKDSLWPKNDKDWQLWKYHNFQPRETFNIAKVKQGNNIDEFINNTQRYQHDLIKLAIESYRRQAFNPVSAIFQFMFVENWPSVNWGAVDYQRQPKLAYKAMKTAYQDILPSVEWNKKNYSKDEKIIFNLWVHNDSIKELHNIRYNAALFIDEKKIFNQYWNLDIANNNRFELASLTLPNTYQTGSYTLVLSITDNNGQILGTNYHEFEIKE